MNCNNLIDLILEKKLTNMLYINKKYTCVVIGTVYVWYMRKYASRALIAYCRTLSGSPNSNISLDKNSISGWGDGGGGLDLSPAATQAALVKTVRTVSATLVRTSVLSYDVSTTSSDLTIILSGCGNKRGGGGIAAGSLRAPGRS